MENRIMKNAIMKSSGLLFMLLLIFSMNELMAQDKKVHFEDIKWEEALKKAEKESKAVFVDVGGAKGFCKQCEEIEKTVFTRADVADFHNSNFVNIKIDMHSEEGKAFSPNLQMLMYPVYVYYSADGEQLGSVRSNQILENPDGLINVHGKKVLEQDSIRKSNKRSITFTDKGWKEALAQAKRDNKLIFLDAYTTWCRPCIQMDRNVFTLNDVADFYNNNFINVKMEMEKDEFGPELADKHGIKAYPTYLFINHEGEVVFKGSGYTEKDEFIKYGKDALKEGGLTEFGKYGVNFQESGWESIKAQAKAENKLIFFDAYAVWCGPCKIMDRDVFSRQDVSEYFNEKFVNAKFDMEKGEGIALKDQYNIRAYPTYMFLNADEEVVHQVVGSMPAEKFLQQANVALSDDNLKALQAKYNTGERGAEFIKKYLGALQIAYYGTEVAKVAEEHLSNQPKKELLSRDNWNIIHSYVRNCMSDEFQYFVKNRDKYANLYTHDSVDTKIYQTFLYQSWNYLSYDKETKTSSITQDKFNEYLNAIQKSGYERSDELIAMANINTSKSIKDWPSYIIAMDNAIANNSLATNPNPASVYRENAFYAANYCPDTAVWNSAITWIEKAIEVGNLNDEQLASYKDIHVKLLEKTGDQEKADQVKASINREELEKAKAKNPMKALIKQD